MKLRLTYLVLFVLLVSFFSFPGAVSAEVAVTPVQGTIGTIVNVSGLNPGVLFQINWDTLPISSGNVTSTGNVNFAVPECTGGIHTIDVFNPNFVFNVAFIVYPTLSVSPASGIIGSIVTVSGKGFGNAESNIILYWDRAGVSGSVSAGANGSWSRTFNVPLSPGGLHSIDAAGNVTYSANVTDQLFTVMPAISVSPSSGTVGSSLTVNATGFFTLEGGINILMDSRPLISGVVADVNGTWISTFAIPVSSGGSHSIDASGSMTSSANITDQTFSVKPTISITPSSGVVGTPVTVSGTGFGTSESGITVTLDSKAVSSGITANAAGSWSSAFPIPSSPGGNRTIDAFGSFTPAASVPDLSFNIGGGMSIDKESARVGDVINISGSGFGQNEPGIIITLDRDPLGNSFSADGNGQWTISRTIPPAAYGAHVIDVYGSITAASAIADKTVNVTEQSSISPSSGNVGDSIIVSGTGYKANSYLTIIYGDMPVITALQTDVKGSFSATFKAPGGKSGNITITSTDNAGLTKTSVFAMETMPPPVPLTITPKDKATIGFIGDAKVNFSWTPVTDPSGVTYDLQVSLFQEFNASLIEHYNLNTVIYNSLDNETLTHGQYFWRVRAVDGAGNVGNWSTPATVKAGFMSVGTLILIIAIVIVVLIVVRILFMLRKK